MMIDYSTRRAGVVLFVSMEWRCDDFSLVLMRQSLSFQTRCDEFTLGAFRLNSETTPAAGKHENDLVSGT